MLNTTINSTIEIVTIAISAEREAALRYAELSQKMREYCNDEAAALFERMSSEEREHEKKLIAWAEQAGLKVPAEIKPVNWERPENPKKYDDEAHDPDQCTPYKAYAYAVHNEERAFNFYSYVAAHSSDPDVCKFAETMAHEELGHAALLRTLRRREWHKQRQNQKELEPKILPAIVQNYSDLIAVAVFIDNSLLNLLKELSTSYPDLKPLATRTREILAGNERLSRQFPPGSEITAALKKLLSWQKNNPVSIQQDEQLIQHLCNDSDRNFTFYDSVMEASPDEETMLKAQELCALSLDRISQLRELTCAPDENASS